MTSRRRQTRLSAFTLVELMMACSITSVALLGVYAVMRQCLEVEKRFTLEWDQRAAAQSAASAIAEVIERTANVPGRTSIIASINQATSACTLTITAMGRCPSVGQTPTIERRRFRWITKPDEGTTITVTTQVMPMAGSAIVAATRQSADETESEIWKDIPSTPVARNLDQLYVRFRDMAEPDAPWKTGYKGAGENTAVWIHAKCGDVAVDCYRSIKALTPITGAS